MFRPFAFATIGLLTAAAGLAQLQVQPSPVGYAGELIAFTAGSVTLKDKDGKTVEVAMTKDWTVSRPRSVEAAAIKRGDFIASANKPIDERSGRSTEVRIMEAGYRPEYGTHMMAQSENAMTHGTVANIARSNTGMELDVAYPGGSRKLIVPGEVKITDFELLDRSVLKPGTRVSAVTRKGADGVPRAGRLTLPPQPVSAIASGPVRTASGAVTGVVSAADNVVAFKGIPYAQPPVGPLRWRAPQPPAAWQDVRKAEQFSDSCIQNIVAERKPWTHEFMAHNRISEDCLYLNVWTPANRAGDRLPVFFWMHGGGYVEGSTAVPAYDGARLASRGVVVVTINYRLGVLGFLAHPELTREAGRSGNYGSLDQVAALQWVQQNIAAFGGDPGNVTIAGQSAGASGVHSLVASPLAKGLFHRAIAQSGSSFVPANAIHTLAAAERSGAAFAAARGADTLAALRALSTETLTARAANGPTPSFRPVIDGHFLPADPNEIYAQGKQNDVPELTGMNLDERSSTVDYGLVPMATHQQTMQQRYGDAAGDYFRLYPNDTQAQSGESQKATFRDAGLVSMFMWGQLRATTAKQRLFTYYWTHALPGPDSARYGAFHTSEVPYVFNTLDQAARPWTAKDRELAQLLGSYWINFMKTGDPNGTGLPVWPVFDRNVAVTMELGDKPGSRPLAEAARVSFWQKYIATPGAIVR